MCHFQGSFAILVAMFKQEIAKLIQEVLNSKEITDAKVIVEYPADSKNGDYSSNVALVAAKKVGKNPMEFAEELVEALRSKNHEARLFEDITVAKPGFINFKVAANELIRAISNTKANTGEYEGQKVMIEFTDPNPFKEFHIGHLYSNIVGESLARLLESAGAEVQRVDYFGDVGMHVAKSLWGLEKKFIEDNLSMEALGEKLLKERISYLGQAYAKGATAYEEDKKAAEEMQTLNRIIYVAAQKMWKEQKGLDPKVDYKQGIEIDEKRLDEVYNLYSVGRAWSMEYFETIFLRLGTKFAGYYPESIAGEIGYQLVKDNIATGVFEESEGAIVFPESQSGLHTRVFINKLGLPTYEAKELGLAPWKYSEYAYDLSIIVTGNEINEYFKVLLTALKRVKPELGEKTKHISHGMVKLPEGKMSSRTGKIVTGEWLINEAHNRALTLSDSNEVAEQVGLGAVKYALLKNSVGKDVEFSFDESVSFEGNSGPYLQYTFARTQSVLRKSEKEAFGFAQAENIANDERELLRLLAQFDEVVAEAAKRFSPSTVATYLFDVAQAFNLFYQKYPILKGEEESIQFRLALTAATGTVLKKGLHLLGIQAPERM